MRPVGWEEEEEEEERSRFAEKIVMYVPVFADDDAGDRWQKIRAFIERWYSISLPPMTENDEVTRLATTIGRKLPSSLSSWMITTAQILETPARGVLRDGRQIENLAEYSSISLTLQAEGDVHWVVQHSDLQFDDPEVHSLIVDHESESDRLVLFDLAAPVPITEFALAYFTGYLDSSNSFSFEPENAGHLLAEIRRNNHPVSLFGTLAVVEGSGWLATLPTVPSITGRDTSFKVDFQSRAALDSAPPWLLALRQRPRRWRRKP